MRNLLSRLFVELSRSSSLGKDAAMDVSAIVRIVLDLGVKDGMIAAVGKISGQGREEIDARGKIVTPGFVDVHTHYDGQATWDERMQPSSWHGVTTVVMGNCGVGFAPCKPQDREKLVELMEGVEDIPGAALAAIQAYALVNLFIGGPR